VPRAQRGRCHAHARGGDERHVSLRRDDLEELCPGLLELLGA
jgi:hypothetical protein